MEIFEYSIFRFVPIVEREEFINIGIILYSKNKKFLKTKFLINQDRISSFCKEADLELLQKYISEFDALCSLKNAPPAFANMDLGERFRWLTAKKSWVIQNSPTHIGYSNDLEQSFEKIFSEQVI